MENRDILIEALREDYSHPSEEQIVRLDAAVSKIAQILVDYFIEQKSRGRKISDPYADGEQSHERNHLRSSVRPTTNRRHEPCDARERLP